MWMRIPSHVSARASESPQRPWVCHSTPCKLGVTDTRTETPREAGPIRVPSWDREWRQSDGRLLGLILLVMSSKLIQYWYWYWSDPIAEVFRTAVFFPSYFDWFGLADSYIYHHIGLPAQSIAKKHKLGGLNNRNVWCHSSRSWKSNKVSAELGLCEGCEGEPVPGLSPWLVNGYRLPVPFHIVFSLCMSVTASKCSLWIRTPVILD